jgi:asparagine synthase (glutamine-hydrolysing)
VQPYWQWRYTPTRELLPPDQLREELMSLLDDATRLRLRADVPVGAYLSGGLDSSVTAALSQRHARNRLRTFSVTFPEREFDESQFQQQVVRRLDTDHQTLHCTPDAISAAFPSVVRHAEKPLLRTAAAPLYLLSRQVQQAGFKVVLTGEGADEMLGGYDIFKEAKVRRFCARQPGSSWRASLFTRLYPYLAQLQSQSPAYRHAFFRARPEDLESPYFSHIPRWEMTSQIKRMFHPEFAAQMCDEALDDDLRRLLPEDYARWPAFCQAQFLETVLLMPGYILSSQGDRVALAHGVEGRFPFLDHRVAEFAASLPPRWKMHGLDEKHLLKQTVKEIVPADVVGRSKQPYRAPDAQSFFAPESGQARGDYIEDLLDPRSLEESGIFLPEAARRLADKARQGKVTSTKDNMALVGILSTELLAHHFLPESAPRESCPAMACTSPVTSTVPMQS